MLNGEGGGAGVTGHQYRERFRYLHRLYEFKVGKIHLYLNAVSPPKYLPESFLDPVMCLSVAALSSLHTFTEQRRETVEAIGSCCESNPGEEGAGTRRTVCIY